MKPYKPDKLYAIKVADIKEYEIALGTRCHLLNSLGIPTYGESEEREKILRESADNPEMLEICKKSESCGAFFRAFEKGETPFLDKENIVLNLYKKYDFYVVEGKHSVCMAKRMGNAYSCNR